MNVARTIGRVWLTVLVLLAMAPGGASAQDNAKKVDLRPRFETGQQIRFKMEVGNTSTLVKGAAKGGRTPPAPKGQRKDPAEVTKSRMEMGITLKVREGATAETPATVDLVFDTLKVSADTGEETIEFDSTKPQKDEGDIVAMVMQSLVGSTLTLKVDRSGNITSVSGGEAFTALGQLAGAGTGGAGKGAGGGAGQLFGPLFSIKKATGMASVGESWEVEDVVDTGLMGGFKMKARHTLRSASGGEANVAVTGRIEPSSEAGSGTVAQLKNSGYTGAYTWDTAAGMLKQMNSSMTVQMETSTDGTPTTTKNESTVKVVRVK